jgi:hypothetical protein
MGVSGQHHAPAALPPGMTRYPLHKRPNGPQGRSGRVRNIWPVPGFDPRTVEPVASRNTDCVVPAHVHIVKHCIDAAAHFFCSLSLIFLT